MARFPRLFGAAALMNLTLLAHCRPLTDSAPVNSSAPSWAEWSEPRATSSYTSRPSSSTSNIPIPNPNPNPTVNPSNGSCTSYNSTPAYTNTPETLDDAFTIEYFPDYDFTSNSPEPEDPSLPDPDGKLMERMAEDEADLPAYLRFVNGTSSSDKLVTNVDDVLQNAGMTSSNSAIAGALLYSLNGAVTATSGTSPTFTSTKNVTVSERDMTVFLESCLLDYDSCVFWDADTMEVVDATMAMAGTDLWETRDENQSVWPVIAQWVLEFGVDILVGDRPTTNDMVIPMRFAPGGVMLAASGPVTVPSVGSS
ncbi:uncharacterized protein PV06_08411 [Exophiala oligosperma]|uniref:Uncharacterized protein n=1 Tax=Exophiala oligosperma TaxID=215243 RepID=A0A0D2BQQ8_9EURO|nr:uncharacterized protein PV06_08411 [Exophiala oligosperma]KIW39837.1 hypothetical protein PV06_08411 [Exophiala oligosperma]